MSWKGGEFLFRLQPDKCTVSSLIKSLQVGLSQEHVQRALDLMDNVSL